MENTEAVPQAFEEPETLPKALLNEFIVASIEDLQTNFEVQKKFATMIKNVGFAYVKLGEPEQRACTDAYTAGKKFFALSPEEKAKSAMTPALDTGYVHLPGVKEHLQIRATHAKAGPSFPCVVPEMHESTLQFYSAMMRISRASLGAIEAAHSVKAGTLTSLLDADPLPTQYCSSLYRYFHYFKPTTAPKPKPTTEERDNFCAMHTDVGLLTIVPVSAHPALVTMHPMHFYRIRTEKHVPNNEPCAVVFGGDSLEHITRNYFLPTYHSVDPALQEERYSLVFLLRARPDAVFDAAAFNSPLLTKFHRTSPPPMTAGEYMTQNYLSKQSQNLSEGIGRPDVNLAPLKPYDG